MGVTQPLKYTYFHGHSSEPWVWRDSDGYAWTTGVMQHEHQDRICQEGKGAAQWMSALCTLRRDALGYSEVQTVSYNLALSNTALLIAWADITTNALASSRNMTRVYGWQKMLGLGWHRSQLQGKLRRKVQVECIDTLSAPLRGILLEPPLRIRQY